MNNISQFRRPNPPLTPNLEDYKQKNKSKSRRKPYSIQPTIPPTPKIYKSSIAIKPTSDKMGEAFQNREREEVMFCPLHPDRVATRFLQSNGCKKMCNKCYLLSRDGEDWDEQVQTEKRKELDQFKGKIKGFGLKLEQASSNLREWSCIGEQNFCSQKQYIKTSFESIRNLLQQKQRYLINQLLSNQQGLKKILNKGNCELEEAKTSINRYFSDIEANYSDIIESLSYEQFSEIIEKYNEKLKYYERKVEVIVMDTSLNVYIPKNEIEKLIEKSSVQTYPNLFLQQSSIYQNKSQSYPLQNNILSMQYQFNSPSYLHESLSYNKISQNRQSRDYGIRQNPTALNQYFSHINKQNYNFDNAKFK